MLSFSNSFAKISSGFSLDHLVAVGDMSYICNQSACVLHAQRQTISNDINNVILNYSFWKCICKQTQILGLIWETRTLRFMFPLILSGIYQIEKISGTYLAEDEESLS